MADPKGFLPSGRTVRCANCGHSWYQTPPEDAAPAPEPETPAADATDTPPEKKAPAKQTPPERPAPDAAALDEIRARAQDRMRAKMTPAKAAAWAGIAAGLAGLAFLLDTYKAPIVAAWPQTASAYALAGREVNVRGLVIEKVAHDLVKTDDGAEIEVRGQIRNVTGEAQIVPLLRAGLTDAAGAELAAWRFSAQEDVLEPGQSAAFSGRAPASLDTRGLQVRFVRKRDDADA